MNVVFFGPPGAGKGTVAGMISDKTGFPHISTGDLFRDAIKNRTELGVRVKSILDEGNLVPDSLTIELVQDRLSLGDTKEGVLLDGFPRTIAQADALSEMIAVDFVLNLQANDDMIVRRLSGRRVCSSCGYIHHVEFRPPDKPGICNQCGHKLYQRKDDMVDAIKNRLAVYAKQTEELITYYREKGLLVDIDGNPDAETVCNSVLEVLNL